MSLIIGTILSILTGGFIYWRQNIGERLGGPIAPSKGFWLYWTIYVWFFLLPYTLLSDEWQDAFLWGWGFLTLSMWVRGIAEIYMLFVTKNWTPKIGITHDLFTLAGLLASYLLYFQSFSTAAWWVQGFALGLAISLCAETYYALAFLKLIREKTKGDKAIWYASKEDPQFLKILRVTTALNWLLYGLTLNFIYHWKFSFE